MSPEDRAEREQAERAAVDDDAGERAEEREHATRAPDDGWARRLVVPLSFKAEMARRGLAPNQLRKWDSCDDGYTDPLDDLEVRAAVRHCLNDVWYAVEFFEGCTWDCDWCRSDDEETS